MKMQRRYTILAVDDDEINLMILSKCVQDAGYTVKAFESGETAWEYLQNNPGGVDIALLDKMMPGVSGIELLRRIKSAPSLQHIPVIIQTGDAGITQMREGLESGAYYYLTKPFHPDILTAIIHAAANECNMREDLKKQMSQGHSQFMGLMQEADFVIKTHEEASVLAASISQAAIYPEFTAVGLMELLSNAIEHGNLEIGCQRKADALLHNRWKQEIAARADTAEYGLRVVRVHLEKNLSGMHVVIRDEGKGFDWGQYVFEDAQNRLTEPNGRGISKALIMLDDLRYVGKGNEVHCNICLPPVVHAHRDTGATLPVASPRSM